MASWIKLNDIYILYTSPLLCLLVYPIYEHGLSFSRLPDKLIPILPTKMEGEVANILDILFY